MTPDQMNPNICPSALEEDGTLDRTKWDGAHKWDATATPVECAECGTHMNMDDALALINRITNSLESLVEKIDAFHTRCETKNHTDTAEAWELLNHIRQALS